MQPITIAPVTITFTSHSLQDTCFAGLLELDPTDGQPVHPDIFHDLLSSRYENFDRSPDTLKTILQLAALKFLQKKSLAERASLPILEDACEKYWLIIGSASRDLCAEAVSLDDARITFDLTKFFENNARIFHNVAKLSQNHQLPWEAREGLLKVIELFSEALD